MSLLPQFPVLLLAVCLVGCGPGINHEAKEVNHLKAAALMAILYESAHKAYPEALTDASGNDPDFAPDDEWGTKIQYRKTETDFEVVSAGPDKMFGTDDDITITLSDFEWSTR